MYQSRQGQKNRRVSDSIISNFVPNLGLNREQVNAKSSYLSSLSTNTSPLPWAVINFDIFWVMLSANSQCKHCGSKPHSGCGHVRSPPSSPSTPTPDPFTTTPVPTQKCQNSISSCNSVNNSNILSILNQNRGSQVECFSGCRGKTLKCINNNNNLIYNNNNDNFWPNFQRNRKLGVNSESLHKVISETPPSSSESTPNILDVNGNTRMSSFYFPDVTSTCNILCSCAAPCTEIDICQCDNCSDCQVTYKILVIMFM